MHIFDRGNILLLPEPLHTALQQAIVWWVERVRTEEAGQRTAGSKVQVSSHHTLDTRESGHWAPSLQRQHEQTLAIVAPAVTCMYIVHDRWLMHMNSLLSWSWSVLKTLVFVSTWSNYSSPPFMTSRAAPEADCQHLASRDPGDGAGLGT